MTPQEKAKNLIDKFFSSALPDAVECDFNVGKLCALIVVDEILEDQMIQNGMRIEYPQYWIEVKREIEKL